MESMLEKQLGREVSVGKVTGNVFGNISIDGISVAKEKNLSDGKLLDIRRIKAGYSLLSLLRWRFTIRSVKISRPRLWLEIDENGELNVPEFAASGKESKKSRFSVLVSNIDVVSGEIVFDDKRSSIHSTIKGINGRLRGTGREMDYLGEIRAQSMEVNARGASKTITDIAALFEMSEWGITVSDFQLQLGKSHLQASAEVFTDEPVLMSAEIQSKLFLEDINEFLATPESDIPPPKLNGIAEIYAVISGKMPNIGGACVVSVPVMTINDLTARNVDAEVRFTENSVDLTYLSVDLSEGGARLSGMAELSEGNIKKYNAEFRMDNLNVGKIMAELNNSDIPVSGMLCGELFINGTELRPGSININGNLSMLDTQLKSQEADIIEIGKVDAILAIDGESAKLDVLREKTRAELKGNLGNDGKFKLVTEVDMPDIGELVSLVADSPQIFGSGRISAEASMEITNPGFRASMGLSPVAPNSSMIEGIADLRGQINVNMPDLSLSVGADRDNIQIGSLTGVIHINDSHINTDEMLLRLGESECRMAAAVRFKKDARHEVNASLIINSLAIDSYAPLMVEQSGEDSAPISNGLVNGNLKIHGDITNIDGHGEISITDLLAGSYRIERIDLPVEISSNVLNIPKLVVSSFGEQITAKCKFTPSGDYDLKVDSSLIELSKLLPDADPVGGTIQLDLSGKGNIESPSLNGKLSLQDFRYSEEDFGNGELTLNLKDEQVHIDILLSNRSFVATFDGSTNYPYQYSAIAQLGNFNLKPALNLAGVGDKIDLRIAGSIDLDGEAADPANSSVEAMFQTILLDVQDRRWRNDGNIAFQLNNGKFQIDSMKMKGADGRFSAEGNVDFDGAMDLKANMENLDLLAISKFLEQPKPIAGKLDCELKINGEISAPSMELTLNASKIVYDQLNLDSISSLISYKRDMLEIEKNSIKAFGGEANIKAIIPIEFDIKNLPTIAQLLENSIYASLDARNINLDFIPEVAPEILKSDGKIDNIHLEVTGLLRSPKINGTASLKNGFFQLKPLADPINDVSANLSIKSIERPDNSMEYRASSKFKWRIGDGRYEAEFLVSDAGSRVLNNWHQILGIEYQTSGGDLPYFRLDLEVDNGQLDGFMKAIPAANLPPIGGNLSGNLHINGKVGQWINEPLEPLAVLNLPLSGNATINSLDLETNGHKIKNRGKIAVSLSNGVLEISESSLLTMPPPIDYASAGNVPPVQFGSATISGKLNADKTFEIDAFGERLHPGLFSSLAEAPAIKNGKLRFEVKAIGSPDKPVIDLSVTAEDVQLPISNSNGKTSIDKLQCIAHYKDESINIEELLISSFDNQMNIKGTVPLALSLMPVDIKPLDRELDMALVMNNFDLSFLNYFVENIEESRGIAEADVRILGTPNAPRVIGKFQLTDAGCKLLVDNSAFAQAGKSKESQLIDIKSVDMNISIDNGDVIGGEASLQIGEGRYEAKGRVEIDQELKPQKFDITFGASPAKIDPFVSLASPEEAPPISGEIMISGHLSGDASGLQEKPILDILKTISGEIRLPAKGVKLDAAGHRITNPRQIYAEIQNGEVNLRSLKLVDETATGNKVSSIAAFGAWQIDGNKSFDATLNLDTELISEIMQQEFDMSGWLTLKLEARGDEIRCFWPPTSGTNGQNLTFGHATIDKFEGNLIYKNQEIEVVRVGISSGNNHVVFRGKIPMSGEKMGLNLDARLNDMGILSFINKDITESSGQGVLGAAITGDMKKIMARETPVQFAGFCRFNDLNVNFYESNMNFEDVEANVEFSFGRQDAAKGFITLKDFRGNMNNGEFALKDDKLLQPGAEILWSRETGYQMGKLRDIAISMTNCSIYQPMVYSILFRGDLVLKGRFNAPIVTGDVIVTEGEYTESLDAVMQRLFSSREIGFKAFLDYPIVNDLEMDVNVQIPGEMLMNNSLVNAEAKAFARVSGSLAKPIVVAQGQVISGKITYFGREFTITEGKVTNESEINPEYSIKAETQISGTEDIDIDMPQGSSLTVQMELNGSLSRPSPPQFNVSGGGVAQDQQWDLSDTDIISILTLGATPGAFLDKGLSGSSPLIMESAKWYLERRAEKLLDLKEFEIQIDPNASKETRLVIAKEIMEQISVLMDVGYGGQQWIGLQREMGKNFAFDGKVSQYGDWSFDLKIKQDFP